jgi:hypothetical protein
MSRIPIWIYGFAPALAIPKQDRAFFLWLVFHKALSTGDPFLGWGYNGDTCIFSFNSLGLWSLGLQANNFLPSF